MLDEKSKKLAELEKQMELLAKQKEEVMSEIANYPVVGKDIVDLNAHMNQIKAFLLSEIKQESEKLMDYINTHAVSPSITVTRCGLTMTDISVHGKRKWGERD